MRRVSLSLSLLLILIGFVAQPLQAADQAVRIAVLAFRPVPQVRAQWQPLLDYLRARLPDCRFELQALAYPDMESAVASREVDFVLTQPAHYVQMAARNELSSPLATLIAAEQGQPVTAFGGVVFTRSDRIDLRELVDLGQGTVAVAVSDRRSLGGYLMQANELLEAGVDPARLRFVETGMPHDRVVDAVLDGRAAAGFVQTGVLEAMASEGKLDADRIRVLNEQKLPDFPFRLSTRLYPEWPFAALPHTADDLARRFAAALFDLPHDGDVVRAIGIHGFMIPADYRPVETLMRRMRVAPFEAAPEFTTVDIWDRYRPAIVIGSISMTVLLVMLVSFLRFNRRLVESVAAREAMLGELELERDRLDNIIAGTHAGTWEWNVQTGETVFNERWAEIVGYRLEELAPVSIETWNRLAHPDDLAECERRLRRHFDGETGYYECECRMRHKAGHWVWVLDRGRLRSRDADGRPQMMCGTHVDITERKRMEGRLAAEAAERELLLASLGEGVYGVDTEGRCTFFNPAAERMLGWSATEVIGSNQHDLFHHHRENGAAYAESECPIFQTLRDGEPRALEEWFWRRSGEGFPVSLHVSPIRSDGRITGAVVAFNDISGERAARAHDRILTTAMEAAPSGIVVTERDGTIVWVNEAFTSLTGYARDEAIGRKPGELVKSGLQTRAFYERLWKAILDGRVWQGEIVNRRRDGTMYHEELLIAPVRDKDGEIVNFVGIKRDVSERKRLEEELRRQATIDMLTGLSNRRYFLEQMERELARMRRKGGEAAVLMLDLDHFKQINDNHGHAAGDEVLRVFARLLRDSLRQADLAGRLGGEEFAVLLPETPVEKAAHYADRLRSRVAKSRILSGDKALRITVSIGVTAMHAADDRVDKALARADSALYRAKSEGRNRVEVCGPGCRTADDGTVACEPPPDRA